MAPTNKRKSDYASDGGFVAADSGDERPTKMPKSNDFKTPSASKTDDEGNPYWEISKTRRVTVSSFKSKKMVSVREYYEQGGKMLPGKKGISMTMEQYAAFLELLPVIEEVLSEGGEKVPRPRYATGREGVGQDGEEQLDEEPDKKANIEATSDEDEA